MGEALDSLTDSSARIRLYDITEESCVRQALDKIYFVGAMILYELLRRSGRLEPPLLPRTQHQEQLAEEALPSSRCSIVGKFNIARLT